MSERDCGKWYCQEAAGYKRLVWGIDIRAYPHLPAPNDNRIELDRERVGVRQWMESQRADGFTGWLAGPGHGNGAAQHYWVWDPHSGEKYMEAWYYDPGMVPSDFGELHRGRGWQLPLVALMSGEPTSQDKRELQEMQVPFVVIPQPQDVDQDEPEPEDDGADPVPPSDDTAPSVPPHVHVGQPAHRWDKQDKVALVRLIRRVVLLSNVHPKYSAKAIAKDGQVDAAFRRLSGND